MRVIRRGLEFEAECNPGKKVDSELLKLLELSVSLVKHMGVSRSRGLGLVEMKLDSTGEMDLKGMVSDADLSDTESVQSTSEQSAEKISMY